MSKGRGGFDKEDLPVIEALAVAVIGMILAVVAVVFRVKEKKRNNRHNQLPGGKI